MTVLEKMLLFQMVRIAPEAPTEGMKENLSSRFGQKDLKEE